jgi:DNA-binding SARP family transcriptional activator
LDFAYEDWAAAFRDSLHAQYVETAERWISVLAGRGDHWAAIDIARAVVNVDPEAEGIEIALIRMYRATGAHAAAAEQYGRYAAAQRSEFGVDVPPLEAL